MADFSYLSGNAPKPASYEAPNMAATLYGMLGNLPNDAYQAQQQARTTRMQQPVTDANGQPSTDIKDILTAINQRGGLEAAAGQLPFLWKQQYLAGEGGGGAAQQPQEPPPANETPSAQGPATLHAASGRQGAAEPARGVTETRGGDTVNSLAAEHNVDLDAFLNAYPGARRLLDRDLTPGQAKGLAERMAQFKGGSSSAAPAAPVEEAPARNQSGGASNLVPPGVTNPLAYAAALEKRAEGLRQQARREGIVGFPTKASEDQAAAYDAKAKEIREQLGKAGEQTGEQKNARDSTVQATKRQEEVQKSDIEDSKKKYDGLQNLGQVGQIGNQKLDRIRSIMSDPNFMSGAGNQIALAWKQWNATLGGDPKAAAPMEEFNKTAQQLLTDDIKAMGASGAGPVRVAEVNIMKQATANLGISPATNCYLVEEAYRVHNDNIAVARMAQQYKAQHGYLDAGWDKLRDKYYADHPLFTKEELADPRLVAPPYLPRDIAADPTKHAQWVRSQGIKPGDPIKTDDPNRPIVWAR